MKSKAPFALRRHVGRSACLLLVGLGMAPRAAAYSDYDLVSEADQAVAEGDFAGAERRLSRIARGSAARADADLVQQKLDRSRGPALETRHDVLLDDQPFTRWLSVAELSSWIVPRLELGAGIEAGSVLEPAELGLDGAFVVSRVRLGAAAVDASGFIGVRRWFDGFASLQGEAMLAILPTGKVRNRFGAARSDEVSTFRAAASHVQRDGLFAEVELNSLSRISGVLRGDLYRYSDGNQGGSAGAWSTVQLLSEPLELALGYAGAYRDTAESRWNATSQEYDPYFTPLLAVRHGPVASVGVRFETFAANASVHQAVVASERDPSTVGYYHSRRDMRYFDMQASVRVDAGEAALSAVYRYQVEAYYTAHLLEIELDVPL